nr:MAG TPA: hypothetical protein [Caudoviricetes sp.]
MITSKCRFSYYSTKPYKLGLLFVCNLQSLQSHLLI